MQTRRSLAFLIIAMLLSACSTTTIKTDLAAHASARVCCSSDRSLPAPRPYEERIEITLGPNSPHFDFGSGLVPFLRISLPDSRSNALEIISLPRASALLSGGDGTLYYADARVIFLAADGTRLKEANLSSPALLLFGNPQTYTYRRAAVIPAEAASIIITSSMTDAGRKDEFTGGKSPSGSRIPLPGGMFELKYTLSPYGNVVALFRDSTER